jgi:hypothetical protein
MDKTRTKIVLPVVRKAVEEVINQDINSPNVAIAWALKHGESDKITLEEVQEIMDMKLKDYIIAHKE